jgi:hypothetical protein
MGMSTTRRKAKPGEVLFFYGRLPGDNADHIGMWGGDGATKRHSNMVMAGFNGNRIESDQNSPQGWRFGKSFLEELENAGFDTRTIEFSIKVKACTSEVQDGTADKTKEIPGTI